MLLLRPDVIILEDLNHLRKNYFLCIIHIFLFFHSKGSLSMRLEASFDFHMKICLLRPSISHLSSAMPILFIENLLMV